MMALIFITGIITWTFIEYGMHHWNGHLLKGRTHFSREHLKHHTTKDYFSTLPEKIRSATPVSLLIWGVSGLLIGWLYGAIFSAGVVTGYVIYEHIHWANHMRPPTNAYERWARRHHLSHHFMDARYNHGVTTPIWDYVFQTHRTPGVIKVPRKFAMEWLLDQDGELDPQFAEEYVLSARRPRAQKAA